MSFGTQYGHYSPYYQDPGQGQDGARAGNAYQQGNYQPLSSYQAQSTASATNLLGGQKYGQVTSDSNQPLYQSSPAYKPGRPSVDAANLSNLAHASSLSQAVPPPRQHVTHGPSSDFRQSPQASASTGHPRAGGQDTSGSSQVDSSQNFATTRPQYGLSQPTWGGAFPYPSQSLNGSSAETASARSKTSTSQAPQPSSTRHATSQPYFDSIPSLTAQAVLSTLPTSQPPFDPSPLLASFQDEAHRLPSQQNSSQLTKPPIEQPRPRAPVPGFPNNTPAPEEPKEGQSGQLQNGRSNLADQSQHTGNLYSRHRSANLLGESNGHRRSPKSQTAMNTSGSQQQTSVPGQNPTTVDPSQVFNDYEYQRRKAADLAKAKAEEAARSPQGQTQGSPLLHGANRTGGPRPQSASSQRSDVIQAAQAVLGDPQETNIATKDQMELEMKQMIEKMRDYKAKDPALFSQIWEQVKKGQGPQASSEKPQPQTPPFPTPTVVDRPASPVQSGLPADSELPAASPFPPDFDRGRFPYLRRKRGGMQTSPDISNRSHVQGARFSHVPEPASPVVTAPTAQMISTTDQTDQKLLKAMQTFHQNLNNPSSTPNVQSRNPPPQLPADAMPDVQPPNAAARFPGNPAPNVLPSNPPPRTLGRTQGSQNQFRVAPTGSGSSDPPVGKTHWPEHRKRALAEAARTQLTTNPENAGKLITAEEVHRLLDQNPSYAQLCDHLEGEGFILSRSLFARYLLTAVPDILAPTQVLSEQRPIPPTLNGNPQGNISHTYKSPSERAPMPPPQSSGQSQLRPGAQVSSSNHNNPNPQTSHGNGLLVNGSKVLEQAATKENKARKRTFSDIVDLTQATSDDEDSGRHLPKSRIDPPIGTQHVIDAAKPAAHATHTSPPAGGPIDKQSEPQLPLADKDHILKEVVVDPINKRRDALRCSTYDPKTIARNVLISSGTHPTMAPLNYHLQILRDRFENVNNDSDLSTFKWDLVDLAQHSSGEQTAPPSLPGVMDKRIDSKAEGGASTKGPSLSSEKATRKSKRPAQPIKHDPFEVATHFPAGLNNRSLEQRFTQLPARAQDNILSNGTNPYSPMTSEFQRGTMNVDQQRKWPPLKMFVYTSTLPSNAPQPSMQAKRRCARCRAHNWVCDGQMPCWRCRQAGLAAKECVVDEGELGNVLPPAPTVTSAIPVPHSPAMELSSPIPPPLPIPNTMPKSEQVHLGRRGRPPLSRSTIPEPPLVAKTSPSKTEVVHGRAGRPPGAKNKAPRSDKGIPKGSQPTPRSVAVATMVRTPLKQVSTPTRGSGRMPATSPPNGIAVVIPSRSPSVIGKRSQEKTKFGVKVEDRSHGYDTYRCGWSQCPAELHNISTLRKHVRNHRRGLQRPFPCQWTGCRDGTSESQAKIWLTYENESQWERHIEKKHIRAVAKAHGEVLDGDSDEGSSDQTVEDELAI